MWLRLGDKRQRDWLVAGVLTAASLPQNPPGPGPVRQQGLGLGDRVHRVICAYESGLVIPGPSS